VSRGFFDNKDVSLLLSIKPHMSAQGQKTIDMLLNMMELVTNSKSVINELDDEIDIKSINKLIRFLSQE